MKFEELRKLMNNFAERYADRPDRLDLDIKITLSSPSFGSRATCDVRRASFGFDWESGMFLLTPGVPLVRKTAKEEVWDLAFDHIYSMSLQVSRNGNPTSRAKWAKELIKRARDLEELTEQKGNV